jgi:hypothetical protein
LFVPEADGAEMSPPELPATIVLVSVAVPVANKPPVWPELAPTVQLVIVSVGPALRNVPEGTPPP